MGDFPRLVPVRQSFPKHGLADVRGAVLESMRASGLAARLQPGSRVAVGSGSRGVSNIATIVKAVVEYWRESGHRPFVFPAMGSHGAATAEGQARVLEHYGISEATVGCPIVSSLEVESLGLAGQGIEAFIDRNAMASDAVFLVNRVKWHTNFEAPIESGLFKMMAIGLGKQAGAKNYHTHGYRIGLDQVVLAVGRKVLSTGKVIGGLAIGEDAHHSTAVVEAIPAEHLERREAELLALVKSWRARFLVDEIDIVIIDAMGKEIAGTGMDTKVVNRHPWGLYNIWPGVPKIHRVFVRSLTPGSHGNATGIGMADVVTSRLAEQVDRKATEANVVTSGSLQALRMPLHYPTDRQCLETVATCVGKLDRSEVTFAWIRNTLELEDLHYSENLDLGREGIAVRGEPLAFPFDGEGNLRLIG